MPAGSKNKIDAIVDGNAIYKNKQVWKQKFYHLCDYIVQQNLNKDLSGHFVNIHEETMAKVLGVDNSQMARILKDCVTHSLLKKDGIMIPATKNKVGGKTFYKTEGKSYGYRFISDAALEEIIVDDFKCSERRYTENRWEQAGKYVTGLKKYREVLSCIKIDCSKIDETLSEILDNKQRKKIQKDHYSIFIKKFEEKIKEESNIQCYNIPFDGVIVPKKISSTAFSYLPCFKYGVIVPATVPVPNCQPSVFSVIPFKKRRKNPVEKAEEPEQTTIARAMRSIHRINNGYMIPSRENAASRVYTTITNLNRELRKYVTIDGKRIIGLDIANSQPLLASILIRRYWSNISETIPDDVINYHKDCEAGMFYENFMQKIEVPHELRGQFKEDFFAKVFFSKVTESNNILKQMFMNKYPSCWQAICEIKGGLYSSKYNEFAIHLQTIEASIIFDTVNVGLMNAGIKAFNIFDSIYVNNIADFEIAKRMTIEAFAAYGLSPTIRLEYKEHIDDLTGLVSNQNNENKSEEEMKKVYTVDEILSKKSKQKPTIVDDQPTKLQHLKRDNDSKMQQFERIVQSIKEEDAIEETGGERIADNDTKIYDFVVAQLKEDGIAVNSENIAYLAKVVKNELQRPAEAVFLNPYVKKSA